MNININFITELKSIILNSRKIGKYYKKKYPNQKYNLENILKYIVYVLKTGISFRNIISPIKWTSIYFHYNRFIKAHIFQRLFNKIRKKYTKNKKLKILSIDASFIANKFGINKCTRNKYYSNKIGNKISVITDKNGLPLSVLVNKGTVHDISFTKKHIKDIKYIGTNKFLLADKGYYSNKLSKELKEHNFTLCVPPKKNSRQQLFYDKQIYKNRIFVEHCFQKIKTYRRLSFRYDKKFSIFKQNVFLVCSLILINKL